MMNSSDSQFPSTHWTLIERVKSTDEAVVSKALEEICAQYHYPLYCYLRRRGCDHHDAQDVLHDFLNRLLCQRALERVEEDRGRLRGYLATAISRHLWNWQQSASRRMEATAEHRTAFDSKQIEERYHREDFASGDTPDRIFERKWAIEMLHHTIGKLAERYHQKGKSALFAALRPALENGGSLRGENSPALAASIGLSEPALRTAMSRLLQEFRECLCGEIRQTVAEPHEVPDELSYLMALFQR